MDGGLTVPEDGDIFLWEMNHCEVSSWPDEHPLLPVNHTGWILQGAESFHFRRHFSEKFIIHNYSPHAFVNTICQSVKSENGDMLMPHNPTQSATAYYSVAHIRYFRIHAHFMIHFNETTCW